jgi:hypothetical protein
LIVSDHTDTRKFRHQNNLLWSFFLKKQLELMIFGNDMQEKSEIPVLPQPVRLGREVPVDNIAFVILKAPGSDDEDVPFPDPDAFFDLTLDSPHPGYSVVTPHPDMICPHHEIRKSKLFVRPFFR